MHRATLLALALVAPFTSLAHDIYHRQHHRSTPSKRAIIDSSSLSGSYDYIIAGGGSAGLVVASILSEDSNATVLVLEAGASGDAVATRRDTPGDTYYDGLGSTSYDWSFKTTSQSNLANRTLTWSRGKILGGSGAINGMYFTRPPQIEIDAWASLIGDEDYWNWDNFYNVMKTIETFTAPTSEAESIGDITYDASVHGTSGPFHSSYPAVQLGFNGNWTTSCLAAGIESRQDPHGGENWGAFVSTSAINPTNWTRSYSRSAYIDPLPPRSNLHILPNATVVRINWDTSGSDIKATSVVWQEDESDSEHTITVDKEVILSGGTVGSPHIMLLSGVGPSSVLSAAGIDVVLDLPGVGQNLQDHVGNGINWATEQDTMLNIEDSDSAYSQTAEWLSFISDAIAYVNLTTLMGDNMTTWISTVRNEYTASEAYIPSTDSTILAGYKSTFDVITETYYPSSVPQVEILLSLNAASTVTIQAALQHPLSRGQITLNSTSAFDQPLIDPGYFSHWADRDILRAAFKLVRNIAAANPIAQYLGTESSPGTSVSSDDDLNTWMNDNVHTDYHPLGSMSMLPEAQGGVVDKYCLVYGTSNVRVVDASIFPMSMSSHTGSPAFAIGYQGATIIRGINNGVISTSNSSSTSSASSSTSTSSTTTTKTKGGAVSVRIPVWSIVAALFFSMMVW
ncbi:GMC oxidoreductase [Guyanagaster necrorhizus]|uniref:GMC oxidoreductase n=1 Tax=Guyanagaster necrorhizus TaxID=856835 RepID=A0A9P7VMB6_9AGAR|nr:GMC oxidoreductase [Guyanagaster necrorhizus MCA 3950]KAG7443851.1 GMC oxidoreductase [Guyanagaster necrorhizus MCA 3950]